MHRFQYSIRNLLGIVAIFALVVLAGRAFVRSFSIPQEAITLTAIGETHFRIHIFATQNNRLPTTLSQLAPRPGYANRVEDAWGQRLIYDVDEEGVISLGSFGRDGQRGGDGEDSDIIRRFRSFDESGAFIAGDDLWVVECEVLERDDAR